MSKKPGVSTISVSLEGKMATIDFAPSITSPTDLCEAIEDMGFEAFTVDVTTCRIGIDGMTCQSCVKTIEDIMSAVEGIREIAVSLTEKQATVMYDRSMISASQIAYKIDDMGFEVAVLSTVPPSVSNSKVSQLSVPNASTATETHHLHVKLMTCKSCVKSIEGNKTAFASIAPFFTEKY